FNPPNPCESLRTPARSRADLSSSHAHQLTHAHSPGELTSLVPVPVPDRRFAARPDGTGFTRGGHDGDGPGHAGPRGPAQAAGAWARGRYPSAADELLPPDPCSRVRAGS